MADISTVNFFCSQTYVYCEALKIAGGNINTVNNLNIELEHTKEILGMF